MEKPSIAWDTWPPPNKLREGRPGMGTGCAKPEDMGQDPRDVYLFGPSNTSRSMLSEWCLR